MLRIFQCLVCTIILIQSSTWNKEKYTIYWKKTRYLSWNCKLYIRDCIEVWLLVKLAITGKEWRNIYKLLCRPRNVKLFQLVWISKKTCFSFFLRIIISIYPPNEIWHDKSIFNIYLPIRSNSTGCRLCRLIVPSSNVLSTGDFHGSNA